MILISHRGNIDGANIELENHPQYLDKAISKGYDVEVDLWLIDNDFFLGHDEPQYKIDIDWIDVRSHVLWVHCKNTEAIAFLNKHTYDINYFWHQEDTVTLTSKGFIWAYPGKQPINNSIAVMPELNNDELSYCIGVCSDNINNYLL